MSERATDEARQAVVLFELHQAPAKKTHDKRLEAIGDFFNSKFGTALLTFIFTVLLSTIITNAVAEIERSRDARTAKRDEDIRGRAELRSSLANGLIDRATRASLVTSALANRLPEEDVKRRWQSYEAAYETYNKMIFLIRGQAESIRSHRYQGGVNPFLTNLTGPISTSFDRLDRCATRAYSDWAQKKNPMVSGLSLRCQSDPGPGTWMVSDETKTLRSCLATYLIQLDDVIWLRNKEADPDARPGFLDRLRENISRGKRSCTASDYKCWADQGLRHAPLVLHAACGRLTAKY